MEELKVGDVIVITNWDFNVENPHYKGEISVIDRIEEPYYYLINDDTTAFTKEQIGLIGNIIKKNNMIKCKKCGSTNVKVDFDQVYTSIPPLYGYKCNECGEHSYVNCDEVNFSDFTSEGNQKYQRPQLNFDNKQNIEETPNTPMDENKGGGLMGWICPKCGRCYSPYTSICSFCISDNGYWTVTCSATGDIPNMFKK